MQISHIAGSEVDSDIFSFFLLKFLEDISPFCGAADTPIMDFWWRLPWVSNPGWIP